MNLTPFPFADVRPLFAHEFAMNTPKRSWAASNR